MSQGVFAPGGLPLAPACSNEEPPSPRCICDIVFPFCDGIVKRAGHDGIERVLLMVLSAPVCGKRAVIGL